jgi:hypothetical protein
MQIHKNQGISMTIHAYVFEARSIQSYVFAGGKLRDIVAASNLIDHLTDNILNNVLTTLEIQDPEDIRFSRKAGGAFYAFSQNPVVIEKLSDVWPLVVNGMAPGLESLAATSTGETEFEAVSSGLAELRKLRNFPPTAFPLVPPIAQHSQRTGKGAISGSESLQSFDGEILDYPTDRKRLFSKYGIDNQSNSADSLAAKFTDYRIAPVWPKALSQDKGLNPAEVLPLNDDRYMAVIHIDGNGLGQLLIKLNTAAKQAEEEYAELYLEFSRLITKATREAARQAMKDKLHNEDGATIAARPLVLGGDDLTVICSAERAIEFSSAFITAFESKTENFLKKLPKKFKKLKFLKDALPKKLTACGGIVFVKSSYPFQSAVHLAESLCQYAKKASETAREKREAESKPSSLVWYKVTTSSVNTLEDIFSQELQAQHGEHKHALTLGAYAVTQNNTGLPSLNKLQKLIAFVANTDGVEARQEKKETKKVGPANKLRQYAGYMKTSPSQAIQHLDRLNETHQDFITGFEAHLTEIWPEKVPNDRLGYGDKNTLSPLADVLSLHSFVASKEAEHES